MFQKLVSETGFRIVSIIDFKKMIFSEIGFQLPDFQFVRHRNLRKRLIVWRLSGVKKAALRRVTFTCVRGAPLSHTGVLQKL